MPVILVLITAAGIGTSVYFYRQYHRTNQLLEKIKTDPATAQQVAEEEVKTLLAKVGQLIVLPTDEQPAVSTVTDIDKLKDQDFFKNGKNGDRLIVYTQAKKAILYDPTTNRIIEVAPVQPEPNAQDTPAATSAATPATEKVSVAIYNGTNTEGLTTEAERAVAKAMPNAEVVKKQNAKIRTYEKTIVIDVTGTNDATVKALAQSLSAEQSTLPADETKPTADILIILGDDYTTR